MSNINMKADDATVNAEALIKIQATLIRNNLGGYYNHKLFLDS